MNQVKIKHLIRYLATTATFQERDVHNSLGASLSDDRPKREIHRTFDLNAPREPSGRLKAVPARRPNLDSGGMHLSPMEM